MKLLRRQPLHTERTAGSKPKKKILTKLQYEILNKI